jgi:hypothetical protein
MKQYDINVPINDNIHHNILLPGDPRGQWTINTGVNRLDKEKLDDFLILLKYTIQ